MHKLKQPSDTMEYYSVMKRKELLIYATTWMNFRNLVRAAWLAQLEKFATLDLGVVSLSPVLRVEIT